MAFMEIDREHRRAGYRDTRRTRAALAHAVFPPGIGAALRAKIHLER